ncbi:hypothetical protein ZIOFF_033628 [Zingiber officinale]|uniref:RING-type domain-containing protein n=2 Tax=Zingiber officinale TaxID=94328 RepID=A0A8J5H2I1_ZINOF|nr:hypothetical protein ZIOFF_033628 [Zingiber officinale]
MGENFGKKAAREQIFSNGDQNDDQNINHSCNVRYNSNRGSQVGFQGRYTYARAPVNYGGSKAIAGSSSSSSSTSSRCSKFFREQQNQTIPRGSTVEQNGRQGKIEDLIKVDRQVSLENLDSRTERRMDNSEDTLTITEHTEPSILQNIYTDINESRIDTSVQPHNQFYFINRDSSSSSIKDTATEYRNFNPATRNNSERLGSGTERWGLKGISCTSISDVLPSACTSSHVPQNRRVDTVRKRPSDAEISAARSKGITASSSGTYVVSNDNGAGSSSYRRDHLTHNRTSRIARNIPTARDDSFPVRIRRGYSEESQMRLPVHGDESAFPLRESFVYPRYTWSQFSVPEVQPESSSRSSHALHSPYRRPDLSNQASQIRFMPHLEDNTGGMLVSSLSLGDRDDYRRLGMGAVAEVLLALERAEQDDALTYEQLLLLETSLLFSGLNFSDRHRDMRMDIDNMSYEELLALEERMGTVSTALSEEQLLRCLKRSIYTTNHVACGITFCGDEDMRCSICQEEYVGEDEVGELPCDHRYHTACIEQWLRQKNCIQSPQPKQAIISSMALISSTRSFLTGSPLSPFPKHKKALHRAPLVACRCSVDDGSSSGKSEAKLAKLAMVTLAAGMLALGSVDPAAAAKSGGRVGGQAFRSAAPRVSGPRINNSRTNIYVNPPIAPPLFGGYGYGAPFYGGWGWSPFTFFAPGPGIAVGVGGGFDVFVTFLVLGAIATVIRRVFGSKDYEDDDY